MQRSGTQVAGDRSVDLTSALGIVTPALVFNEATLLRNVAAYRAMGAKVDCRLLFSLKACSLLPVTRKIATGVDGFACSSPFEVLLASEIRSVDQSIHFTSPGLRPNQVETLRDVCDYISFNSIGQVQRFRKHPNINANLGLRVNPSLPFVSDDRYDPCRRNSKLGVSLSTIESLINSAELPADKLTGIHVHNNCDSVDFGELLLTVRQLDRSMGRLIHQLEWINLGGGYLIESSPDLTCFVDAVQILRSKCDVEIYIEPGAGIVRSAGCFVGSVVDIINGDDCQIAVLDLTVNHWPEIFEYQFEPDVEGHVDDGRFTYILAGCSCLAGDVFGEYSFNEPLEIGSRLVFPNAGAYSIVKAHMFNGINLPNIYALTETGELVLIKKFSYEDFLNRNGVDVNASVRT